MASFWPDPEDLDDDVPSNDLVTAIQRFLSPICLNVQVLALFYWQQAQLLCQEYWPKIQQTCQLIQEYFDEHFGDLWHNVKEWATELSGKILNLICTSWPGGLKYLSDLWTSARELAVEYTPESVSRGLNKLEGCWPSLRQDISTYWPYVLVPAIFILVRLLIRCSCKKPSEPEAKPEEPEIFPEEPGSPSTNTPAVPSDSGAPSLPTASDLDEQVAVSGDTTDEVCLRERTIKEDTAEERAMPITTLITSTPAP